MPYGRDGIDVAFDVGHGTISVDVALEATDKSLVILECKRWGKAVEQVHVYAFAAEVERLRETTGRAISGFYMVKTGVQIGGLGIADHEEIGVFQCCEDQTLPNFMICALKFDAIRKEEIRAFQARIHETVSIGDSVSRSAAYVRNVGESVAVSDSVHSVVTRDPKTTSET